MTMSLYKKEDSSCSPFPAGCADELFSDAEKSVTKVHTKTDTSHFLGTPQLPLISVNCGI